MVRLTFPSFGALLVRTMGFNLADPTAPPLVLSPAGTGIVTKTPMGELVLLTAGHVVTGLHAHSGQPLGMGGTPQFLALRLPDSSLWSAYYWVRVPLRDTEGAPLWRQHPAGPQVDVVAVPIPRKLSFCDDQGVLMHDDPVAEFDTNGVVRPELVWHELDKPLPPIHLDVADDLSIVGFPFGVTGGKGLAVWTRGFIATELQFDHDNLPMYLIDSRTRPGQSGAPVIFYSRSGQFPTGDGIGFGLGSELLRFMGIYSGRVTEQSDLGRVFKVSAVMEVLSAGAAPPGKR